jgi:hypothetical protein
MCVITHPSGCYVNLALHIHPVPVRKITILPWPMRYLLCILAMHKYDTNTFNRSRGWSCVFFSTANTIVVRRGKLYLILSRARWRTTTDVSYSIIEI